MVSVLHQVQYNGNCFNSVPGMILTFVFFPHFGQSRYLPVFSMFPPIGADGRGRTFTLLLTRQLHRLLYYVSKCKILLFLIFQSPFAKGPGLFSGTPHSRFLIIITNYFGLSNFISIL